MTTTLSSSTRSQPSQPEHDFDFDRYSDNVVQSAALPWVQLITPKDKKLPFGLFLKKDCAEAVNFQLSEDWQPFTATFESGEAEVEDEGYLTQILRLCVIRQTTLEGYGKNQWGKFEWLGAMYDQGQLTDIGLRVRNGGQDFYQATRYLVFCLNRQYQLLQDAPLQLKAKGAFGASLGVELREFQSELSKAFFQAAKAAGKRFTGELNQEALSLGIFQAKMGLRRSEHGAYVCYLSDLIVPVFSSENFGKSKTVGRRGGADITLHGVNWRDLFIPKDSDMGQILIQAHADHVSFGQRVQPEPFVGVGMIPNPEQALNSLRFGNNGSVFISFPFNCWVGDRVIQYHCEAFGDAANWLADNLQSLQKVEITGTRIHGTVRVEHIEAVTEAEPAPLAEFDDF
jgi:Family of unknown function (DUF5895)